MAERRGVKQHRRSVKGPASAALSKLPLSAPRAAGRPASSIETQPPGRSRCPGQSGLKAGFNLKTLSCAGNMLKVSSAITNYNHSPRQSSSSACP